MTDKFARLSVYSSMKMLRRKQVDQNPAADCNTHSLGNTNGTIKYTYILHLLTLTLSMVYCCTVDSSDV